MPISFGSEKLQPIAECKFVIVILQQRGKKKKRKTQKHTQTQTQTLVHLLTTFCLIWNMAIPNNTSHLIYRYRYRCVCIHYTIADHHIVNAAAVANKVTNTLAKLPVKLFSNIHKFNVLMFPPTLQPSLSPNFSFSFFCVFCFFTGSCQSLSSSIQCMK